jgi:hypothetical protein
MLMGAMTDPLATYARSMPSLTLLFVIQEGGLLSSAKPLNVVP